MTSLTFNVTGHPGAQGSKRHVGRGILVESSKKVAPWRQDVKAAAEHAMQAPGTRWRSAWDGPVAVTVAFLFRRPKAHFRTGRNAHMLRDNAPDYPTGRNLGDVDKLARSTLDALVAAGVIVDDSLVVELDVRKEWGATPGAVVSLVTLTVDEQVA